jgi:hypothetical protein
MIREKRYIYTIIILILSTPFFFPGCDGEPEVRRLNESTPAITSKTEKPPAPDKAFRWQKPNHWKSMESKGLRLATFAINQQVLCTIIPLSRDGGGLEANIMRWSAQLGQQLTPEALETFANKKSVFKTKTNLTATLLNFNPLISDEKASSMMVTIISVPGTTLFIKMVGPKKGLEKEHETFIRFCQTVSYHP